MPRQGKFTSSLKNKLAPQELVRLSLSKTRRDWPDKPTNALQKNGREKGRYCTKNRSKNRAKNQKTALGKHFTLLSSLEHKLNFEGGQQQADVAAAELNQQNKNRTKTLTLCM